MTWVNSDASGWANAEDYASGSVLNDGFTAIGIATEDKLAKDFAARIDDPHWALELSKTVIAEHRSSLAAAAALASQSKTSIKSSDASRVASLCNARRGPVPPTLRQRIKILVAFCAALLVWLYCVLRFSEPKAVLSDTSPTKIIALYGEHSTRTRHLLPALGNSSTVLLLGRPSARVAQTQARLDPNGTAQNATFLRPISWSSAFTSLPQSLRSLTQGRTAITQCGYLPSTRALIGMFYRIIQGNCHAVWWRQTGLQTTILLGHTGTADTTKLEAAAQACGSKTVHFAHGVSLGWMFTAYSDVAYWPCQHDADWHDALGGYAENKTVPATKPSFVSATGGWQVYSNYAHPTSSAYQAQGLNAEFALIKLVLEAAEQCAMKPASITWNLHPAHVKLPPADLDALFVSLNSSGMHVRKTPLNHDDLMDTSLVLTTPSTVALDALKVGKLPIIIQTYASCDNAAPSAFQHRANNAMDLAQIIQNLSAPDVANAAFDEAFDRIKPSIPMHEIAKGLT